MPVRDDVDHLIETVELALDRLDRLLLASAEGCRWSQEAWADAAVEVRGLVEQIREEAWNVALVTDTASATGEG